jgi:hypothetical protein
MLAEELTARDVVDLLERARRVPSKDSKQKACL